MTAATTDDGADEVVDVTRQDTARRAWLLGLAPTGTGGTPPGVPDVATMAGEVADLRERLADAERRAREAELALPHLLELGQRTVNGLLNDARERGRGIIEAARTQAADELDADRAAVRREARELDALRMAVAAEAMGLEEIRAELQRRVSVSAVELARIASHPLLLGGQPLHLAVGAPTEEPSVRELPAVGFDGPFDAVGGRGVGVIEASVMEADAVEAQVAIGAAVEGTAAVVDPLVVDTTAATSQIPAVHAAPAAPGFAHAWAEAEDEEVAEAFERFFSAEVGNEPSRDWILADDTKP